MFAKASVALLLVTNLFLGISARNFPDVNTKISLLRLMARSNDLMQRNPSQSTDCFKYYIPLIEEMAKTYQQNHDYCLQASTDGRSEAEAATLEKQIALAASASSSCDSLSQCSQISIAVQAFECYAELGAKNAKTMYAINVNASENLSDLQEKFRLVQNREYKCTNETKYKYEGDSDKAYEDFTKCILGIIDEPTPTEATAKPETTTASGENGAPESKLPEEDLSFRR